MTILLVSDSFRPITDGVGICVENYARELAAAGHRVAVAAPWTPDAERFDEAHPVEGFTLMRYASFALPGWRPYRVGVPRLHGIFQTLLSAWIAAGAPEVVHSHSPFVAGRLARRVARRTGALHVSTFHSKYREDFLRSVPWRWAADRFAASVVGFYETVDAVWAPSEGTGATLAGYGYRGAVAVVRNAADFEPLDESNAERLRRAGARRLGFADAAPPPLVLLFVGQHRWEKNPQLILEAVAELARRIGTEAATRQIRLVCAGDGPDAGAMRRMAARLGIDRLTTFLGLVLEREVLAELYARADLFLFPSRYDNAPLVLYESAAFATPAVVAAGSTAAAATTVEENAFHTEPNPSALADLLAELLSDRQRLGRVGAGARRDLTRSWREAAGEASDRYRALIGESGGAPHPSG